MESKLKLDDNACKKLLEDLRFGDHLVIGARTETKWPATGYNLLNDIVNLHDCAGVLFTFQMSLIDLAKYVPQFFDKKFSKNILLEQAAKLTVNDMERRIVDLKLKGHNVKVIFLENMQIISTIKKYASRREEVVDITAQLKKLATSQNIIVVSQAQLTRGVESRKHLGLEIDDLRESSDYRYLDKVVLLFRTAYFEKLIKISNHEIAIDENLNRKLLTYIAKIDSESKRISALKKVRSILFTHP